MVVQKYSFGHGRGNGRETDIAVNTDDFAVNAAYILVMVYSKTSTIRSRYGDAALFLHNYYESKLFPNSLV